MKSVTDHLAIISSFTASYTIAESGIFFPIFRKVLVQNSETTLFLNLLILFMTEFQKLE